MVLTHMTCMHVLYLLVGCTWPAHHASVNIVDGGSLDFTELSLGLTAGCGDLLAGHVL